jgi:hypothetical protein
MEFDKAFLIQKYNKENLSFSQIAKLVGCTPQNIYAKFKRLNLKARGRTVNPENSFHTYKYWQLGDPDWLNQFYLSKNWRIERIALKIGCSPASVRAAFRRLNIPLKSQIEKG